MDEDQKAFLVKVSGICSNFVFNYVYLHPDTCRQLWREPEFKMAYIHVSEELEDVYAYSAALLDMDETVILGLKKVLFFNHITCEGIRTPK